MPLRKLLRDVFTELEKMDDREDMDDALQDLLISAGRIRARRLELDRMTVDSDGMPKVLTDEEMAAIFQVSKEIIHSACRNGEIPGAFKIGKSWRATAEDFMQRMASHKKGDYHGFDTKKEGEKT